MEKELSEMSDRRHKNMDRMSVNDDPSRSMIRAVRSGDLDSAQSLINIYGLSYAKAWSNGYELLCGALKCKHRSIAKMLLMKGAEVNADKNKCRKHGTPLLFATKCGYREIVTMLLKRKAEVDAESSVGVTALYRAATLGHVMIARELLTHGARVNKTIAVARDKGYTPLHHAASLDNELLVKLLLSYGADEDARSVSNDTALHVATKMGKLKALQFLLNSENVNSLGENNESVLLMAVKGAALTIVELILHYRPIVSREENRKGFYAAILQNVNTPENIHIVEALVRYGFNISPADAKNSKLFYRAIRWNYVEIVKAFVKFGADVNMKNDNRISAIEYAIRAGRQEITKLLWNAGAKITVTRDLFYRVMYLDNCAIVDTLLNNATNLKLNATDCTTALLQMLSNLGEECSARARIVGTLITRGADVNATTHAGETGLHLAACHNYPKIAKLLLDNGTNIDATNLFHKTTALHLACQNRCAGIVKLLVERNADLEIQNYYNKTALHYAAANEFDYIFNALVNATIGAENNEQAMTLARAALAKLPLPVKILLDHGANVNGTCIHSMTPLDYATLFGSKYYSSEDAHDDNHDFDFIPRYAAKISIEIIKNHIIASMAIGLNVSLKNIEAINRYNKRQDILQVCQTEISNMKTQTIGDSNVKFYNVLTGNVKQLVSYARNEEILEALERGNFAGHFPTYSMMIIQRIKQGKHRNKLLESGLKSLNALVGHVLPDLAGINISNYLTEKDLENLANADPSDDDNTTS